MFPGEVEDVLSHMKGKYSLGPDGIPTAFLKGIASSVAAPLSQLFSWSLVTAECARVWKEAIVSPLWKKKGSKAKPDSYRPISKTSSIAKTLEKIITNDLKTLYEVNDVLSTRQFGFRAKRSTVTQLLNCVDEWSKNLNSKLTTHIAYIDFKKCFDSVSHPKLVASLRSVGVGERMVRWVEEYLRGRTQRVSVPGALSQPAPILSGLCQGSVFGPAAFLAFATSLTDKLHSLPNIQFASFADDQKLYSTCPRSLQHALDVLSDWCSEFQLRVAPEKSQILTIGQGPSHSFYLDGVEIPHASEVRDLGVIIDSGLTFGANSLSLAKAASRASFSVRRSFQSRRVAPLLKAYLTYVRPKLEYASVVASPLRAADSDIIEKVQRQFTKHIFVKCGLKMRSYKDRLTFLRIDSLVVRRAKLDLTMAHKIFHNQLPDCHVLTSSMSTRNLRNNNHLLCDVQAIEPRRHFFANRVVSLWNDLPDSTTNASLATFKKRIKF
jgi:hypothetical protein